MAQSGVKASLLTDRWTLEVLASILSMLSFVCIIFLLRLYDENPIFRWHGITLNTVVSVLATISKACLMFALAESISQWKYILFYRQRRLLKDFDSIDKASRGPFGSFKLLWMRDGR